MRRLTIIVILLATLACDDRQVGTITDPQNHVVCSYTLSPPSACVDGYVTRTVEREEPPGCVDPQMLHIPCSD